MNRVPNALQRCSPLTDSIRLARQFMVWSIALAMVVFVISTAKSFLAASASDRAAMVQIFAVGLGITVVVALPAFFAIRLVLQSRQRTQDLCLFLRAFRGDAQSTQLRTFLKAALGESVCFAGIRPPSQRAGWLANLFSPLFTGLRYAGTSQFELVAGDHNWLARLLATSAQARFTILDARDITPGVVNEVALVWEVFGRDRLIFVIDDRQSAEAWAAQLAATAPATLPAPDPAALMLVVWPSSGAPDPQAFTASVQRHLATIPAGVPAISAQALEVMEGKVAKEDWDLRWEETPAAIILASFLGVAFIVYLFEWIIPGSSLMVTLGAAAVLQILFWLACFRLFRQAARARVINPAGAPSFRRPLMASILMLTFVGLWAGLIWSLSRMQKVAIQQAAVQKSRSEAMSLAFAVEQYATDYGRLPFQSDQDEMIDLRATPALIGILRGEDKEFNPRAVQYLDSRGVDGWGTPFRLAVDVDYDGKIVLTKPALSALRKVVIFSAGPDGRFDTADDFTAFER